MRVLLVVALSLALLAPTASAAYPVEGQARVMGPVEMHGAHDASAPAGLIDLAHGKAFSFSWAHARGVLVDRYRESTRTGIQDAPSAGVGSPDGDKTDIAFDAAKDARVVCGPSCLAVLVADFGSLGERGEGDATLARTTAPIVFATSTVGQGPDTEFVQTVPAGSLSFATRGIPTLPPGAKLVLLNATLAIDGRAPLETFVRDEPRSGTPDQPYLRQWHTRYLELTLEGAQGATSTPLTLYASQARVALQGDLAVASATGALLSGSEKRALAGGAFALGGALALDARSEEESGPLGATTHGFDLAFQGQAVDASQGGADLLAGARVERVKENALLVGALAILAVAAALAPRAIVIPFYTRIAPSRVLSHPSRAHLHALIQRSPGIGIADLVRETSLRRIVVRHHLHMLEASGHVRSAKLGGRRGFQVVGAVSTLDATRALALRDPTRRAVALVLAGSDEGLTQRDLVARTGLSQRLVSYHLQRLEQAGFLEKGDGSLPRRYQALRDARQVLAAAE